MVSVQGEQQWQLPYQSQPTVMPAQTTAMSTVYPLVVPPNVQVVQQPNLQLVQHTTQTVAQGPSTIFFAGAVQTVSGRGGGS